MRFSTIRRVPPCGRAQAPRHLTLCGLFEHSPFDAAGVVFSVQRIARELGPLLPAIEMIVHAVERQRLDFSARGHMKIGIFVPAINVKEKFAQAGVKLGMPELTKWSG